MREGRGLYRSRRRGRICGHYVNERVPRRTFGNLTATADGRPDVARAERIAPDMYIYIRMYGDGRTGSRGRSLGGGAERDDDDDSKINKPKGHPIKRRRPFVSSANPENQSLKIRVIPRMSPVAAACSSARPHG